MIDRQQSYEPQQSNPDTDSILVPKIILTEFEKEIKVFYFKFLTFNTSEQLFNRITSLTNFIKHLGFLVFLMYNEQKVEKNLELVLFVEPHKCSCISFPYREKILVLDIANIQSYSKDNSIKIEKIVSFEEYTNMNSELKAIENNLQELINVLSN